MKILQVITSIRKASGASTFCGALSNQLVLLGHDVTIAISESAMGEEHYCLDPRVTLCTIERFLTSDENLDVVHVHGIWEMSDHRVCAWARERHIPYVLSPHGSLAPWAVHHHWLKKKIAWRLFFHKDMSDAALIHATAPLEKEWLKQIDAHYRITLVPLGTDLPMQVVRGTHEDSGKRTLLFVGRVFKVKALDRLIEAFQMVPHDGWKLRIVGPDQAGHMTELKMIAGPDVEFAGPKFDAELEEEYARCDALALVSHTENFGATVVDAMAYGKPVITSTNTPWQEVAERKCGRWVDNDPRILSKAIAEMMTFSDAERAEMGARGRKLVEEKYTWNAVGKEMLKLYADLLTR